MDIVKIQEELTTALANPETVKTLIATTFKGLSEGSMRQAMLEAMLRGFVIKDFLEKNVYAIPYGSGYSLVTSIDLARKIGSRSGVVGKSEPTYDDGENGKDASCSITIKKRFPDGYIGEFMAKVYFAEFSTGKNQWATKPRMMIAKVAEMHALRMACPEELSQTYSAEEMERGERPVAGVVIDKAPWIAKMEATTTVEELRDVCGSLPPALKLDPEIVQLKELLKGKYAHPAV